MAIVLSHLDEALELRRRPASVTVGVRGGVLSTWSKGLRAEDWQASDFPSPLCYHARLSGPLTLLSVVTT